MITQPTVLVLGAGASAPYGFPLGITLVDQVCSELIDASDSSMALPFMARLGAQGYENSHVMEFAMALRGARPYSIDAFLEMRREFLQLGKAVIADVLLRAEAASSLFSASDKVDWYRYLFNKFLLLRNEDYFTEQARKLSIVTFNFDRSLEFALFLAVRNGFGVTDARARELVAQVQIHHLHGVLGEPEWLTTDRADVTPFGIPPSEFLVKAVRMATDKIKIVHEEIEDATVTNKAKAALHLARFVYFLGFGFDERNLEKLGPPESMGKATVRGTAFGYSEAEQSPVVRYFKPMDNKLHLYDLDVIGFLRQRAEALFE